MTNVICAAAARVHLGDELYLLAINWGQQDPNTEPLLVPITSVLRAHSEDIEPLRQLGVQNIEESHELRFAVPYERLQRVRRWFAGKNCREARAEQLIRESFGDSHKPERVEAVGVIRRASQRTAYGDSPVMFIDVFDIRFEPQVVAGVRHTLRQRHHRFCLATRREIDNEQLAYGGTIDITAKLMLHPTPLH